MKKIFIGIDNSNLFADVRNNFGENSRIDYEQLVKEACQFREYDHVDVNVYISEIIGGARQSFYHSMEYMGYNIHLMPLVKKGDNYVEKGLDVALAVDMTAAACRDLYTDFALVAGDRDYIHMIEVVRDMGKFVSVVFFKNSCSDELRRKAHKFIDLNESVVTKGVPDENRMGKDIAGSGV